MGKSLELFWSHTGHGACGVVLSPISTMEVGGEGTDQLCHLTGNLTEYEGEKPASPWALGLQCPTADSNWDIWTWRCDLCSSTGAMICWAQMLTLSTAQGLLLPSVWWDVELVAVEHPLPWTEGWAQAAWGAIPSHLLKLQLCPATGKSSQNQTGRRCELVASLPSLHGVLGDRVTPKPGLWDT